MNRIKLGIIGSLILFSGIIVGFTFKDFEKFFDKKYKEFKQYLDPVDKVKEAISYIEYAYFKEVSREDLADKAIMGMLDRLDPHSFYINKKQMEDVKTQMQGAFEGIGIEFAIIEDTLTVVAPLSGGPSARQGILAGDKIVKVNGENIAGIGLTNDRVFKLLRGPKGSKVTVSIKRYGVEELFDVEITRDVIPLKSVDFSYMISDKVGYIKVNRFAQNTYQEFFAAFHKLKKLGMEKLILDLRSNPGGYMNQANMLADAFLDGRKLIVYTEGRLPSVNEKYYTRDNEDYLEGNAMVVLIDEGSASGSEIVAGALQDWDRALLVGRRTFGKGLVQYQKEFQDGSAMRIVVARYFIPSGRCIQKDFDKTKKEYDREIWERFKSGEVYDSSKIKLPDSLKYKTKGGRTVYGGGGVIPDVFLPRDTTGTSKYLTKLFLKGVFRNFALEYVSHNKDLKERFGNGISFAKKFEVSEKLLKEFTNFAGKEGVNFNKQQYEHSKKYIKANLKAMIGRVLFNDEGFYPAIHEIDNELQEALKLLPEAEKLYKNYYTKHK